MIRRIVVTLIANLIALLAAAYFIPGVDISGSWTDLAILVAILTAINLFIRPIIKLFLSPIILVTFGIFNFVINGAILYIIDIYFENITIGSLEALLLTTLLFSLVNTILGIFKK